MLGFGLRERFAARKLLLGGFILPLILTSTGGGLAQDQRVYESAQAVSGKQIKLGVFGTANTKECRSDPAPEVRVVAPPQHGSLVVEKGTLTTDRYPNCPKLKVPVQILMYQPRSDYVGQDNVAFVVSFENGTTQARSIAISVIKSPEL